MNVRYWMLPAAYLSVFDGHEVSCADSFALR